MRPAAGPPARRRPRRSAAAAVALTVPAAVALAGTATFTGKGTDDPDVTVQFTRHGWSHPFVTDSQASDLFFTCSDGLDGRGDLDDISTARMDIKGNGKFSFRDALDLPGEIASKIRVKGRFESKTKATGTVKEVQSDPELTCKAKDAWKAKK